MTASLGKLNLCVFLNICLVLMMCFDHRSFTLHTITKITLFCCSTFLLEGIFRTPDVSECQTLKRQAGHGGDVQQDNSAGSLRFQTGKQTGEGLHILPLKSHCVSGSNHFSNLLAYFRIGEDDRVFLLPRNYIYTPCRYCMYHLFMQEKTATSLFALLLKRTYLWTKIVIELNFVIKLLLKSGYI